MEAIAPSLRTRLNGLRSQYGRILLPERGPDVLCLVLRDFRVQFLRRLTIKAPKGNNTGVAPSAPSDEGIFPDFFYSRLPSQQRILRQRVLVSFPLCGPWHIFGLNGPNGAYTISTVNEKAPLQRVLSTQFFVRCCKTSTWLLTPSAIFHTISIHSVDHTLTTGYIAPQWCRRVPSGLQRDEQNLAVDYRKSLDTGTGTSHRR